MDILYKSTRNSDITVTASQAIIKGLSEDGGLFVPVEIPKLPVNPWDLAGKTYKEVAFVVLRQFLSDYTDEEIKECIEKAYDDKFDTKEIAPLRQADGAFYLELFHGKTIAFKDMALSILPHLLTTAAKKQNIKEKIVILTATSGDTGKAALAGFADVPGTAIIVFYPRDGVSRIQEKQMVTQTGDNVNVVAIKGNFDDAQNGVKEIFGNKGLEEKMLEEGYRFSSANSINIGRLVPQVAYYVYAYAKLVETGSVMAGDKINIAVPTGNFGNILAAYYAKNMGLPVNKLICASNENKVLFDFFESGVYDKNRDFILTTSPSMDILVSSNLERLIYMAAGNNAEKNAGLMKDLKEKGKYEISEEMKENLKGFVGGFAKEEEVAEEIKHLYNNARYVIDTHTAVASSVYRKYKEETKDKTVTVIASTASPYKFSRSVMSAIDEKYAGMEDFALMDELSRTSGTAIPAAIEEIRTAKVLHTTVCDKVMMQSVVEKILSGN
ncbi:MAG: threonine synthase [Lachnospiraceae bacterium]|nr:threonine synthase [Lachnospiraceae bacterium]